MKISNISYLRYPLINVVEDALEGGEYVDQSEIPPIISQTTSGVCYAIGPCRANPMQTLGATSTVQHIAHRIRVLAIKKEKYSAD